MRRLSVLLRCTGIGVWLGTVLMLLCAPGTSSGGSGEVQRFQKISSTEGGFTGVLENSTRFGSSLANLGDLDGDGVTDIAVGTQYEDGVWKGAVWVLFLNADGTVRTQQKIGDTQGGFTGILVDNGQFGASVANIGDMNGDGVTDIAVGSPGDGDGGNNGGSVWILFLNTDGTVKGHQKISSTEGGFGWTSRFFGASMANLGDLDGDGVTDLAVGGPEYSGVAWVIFLNADGTVKAKQKISSTEGGFTGILDNLGEFGASVANIGDLDGDGVTDLAVGAKGDNGGGNKRGAVWVLFLNTDGTVKAHQKISSTEGGFTGILQDRDYFGSSVSSLGDLDEDGVTDLAVGAHGDRENPYNQPQGAVWVLFLNANGTVKAHQKINDIEGYFFGILNTQDDFGFSVASVGDLDGDGATDLAVGASRDEDGGGNRGAVWMLFLKGVDTTPPSIVALSPADEATDVPLNSYLKITFNERVLKQTGNITIKRSADDATIHDIPGTHTQLRILNNPPTVLLGLHQWGLHGETSYYILIDPTAISDTEGNGFAGIADPTIWNFTTGVNLPLVLEEIGDQTVREGGICG